MKFQIVIDKAREEEVVARIHARTLLTDKPEELVTSDRAAEFKSGFRDYISRRCFTDLKKRYSL